MATCLEGRGEGAKEEALGAQGRGNLPGEARVRVDDPMDDGSV